MNLSPSRIFLFVTGNKKLHKIYARDRVETKGDFFHFREQRKICENVQTVAKMSFAKIFIFTTILVFAKFSFSQNFRDFSYTFSRKAKQNFANIFILTLAQK
jgi:hypothetical protein